MSKNTTALTIVILMCVAAFAQPDTLWTKTFGGAGNDNGRSVKQTMDGGYIIVGYTDYEGFGSTDMYLIKSDQNGDTLWTQTFGGSYSDFGSSVQQTTDGGYIVAGSTQSYGAGSRDVWLIKTDANGNEDWYQTFGGSEEETGSSVQQTTDGGYIIVGSIGSYPDHDVYLIKTDLNGDSLWTKTFGGYYDDAGYSVQQTTDGGYIITGYTESYGAGYTDVYLIKTDTDGDLMWTQTFGGIYDEEGFCVQLTLDGGYIIAGWTSSYGAGNLDVYLIKTDANGDTTWTQTFGGSYNDWGESVQQTTDGGYIIAGCINSYGAGFDVWLIKSDANGNESWSQTFGGENWDFAYDVQQTTDGGYIITGYTESYGAGSLDVYLIKTDANGDSLWTQTFGGSYNDWGESVEQTSDGGYIIAGYTDSYGAGGWDVWLIRLDSEGTLVEDFGNNQPSSFTLHPCSPNPFNPSTELTYSIQSSGEVSLAIFDITGCEVFTLIDGYQSAGTHKITWNAENFPSGIYFARLTSENGQTQTQKLVLMK